MSHENFRRMQGLDTESHLGARSLDALRDDARAAARWHDEIVEARVAKSPLACKAGCAHCCCLPVSASFEELVHLAAHVAETFGADEVAALAARLAEEPGQGPVRAGDTLAARTCALLVEGLCSVHAARPMACRGWNSLDVAPCIVAAREPDEPPSVPVDSRVRGTATAIAEGMREGARRLGLDDSVLDLRSTLRALLGDHEQWTRRWFAGERLPDSFHGSPELSVELGDDGRWRTRPAER